jgi:rod shape-determining protein MreC
VIADAGGLYSRSLLVAIPHNGGPVADAIAMDGSGLVGRVIEAGDRSARILLITDINSRVPVSIGAQGDRALMIGTNGSRPNLTYWSPGAPPREGMVVVTSAIGGVFPSGLPIGTVHYTGRNTPVVMPFAGLDRLRLVRLFEYQHIGTAISGAKNRLPRQLTPAPVGQG